MDKCQKWISSIPQHTHCGQNSYSLQSSLKPFLLIGIELRWNKTSPIGQWQPVMLQYLNVAINFSPIQYQKRKLNVCPAQRNCNKRWDTSPIHTLHMLPSTRTSHKHSLPHVDTHMHTHTVTHVRRYFIQMNIKFHFHNSILPAFTVAILFISTSVMQLNWNPAGRRTGPDDNK